MMATEHSLIVTRSGARRGTSPARCDAIDVGDLAELVAVGSHGEDLRPVTDIGVERDQAVSPGIRGTHAGASARVARAVSTTVA